MKTNIKIDMSEETRKKISESKSEYHKKITQLLNSLDDVMKLKKEIESKKRSNTKNIKK